jgi:flagellar motor switch protein FliN/FliY
VPTINPEFVNQFADAQAHIWQQASRDSTEALGMDVSFSSAIAIGSRPEDATAELIGPMLALHFSFAHTVQDIQTVILHPDAARQFVSLATGNEVEDIDPTSLEAARPALISIVQGMCKGMSAIRGVELSITEVRPYYQLYSLPGSLQQSDEIVRVQVGITIGEFTGSLSWLLSEQAMRLILNIDLTDETESDEEVSTASTKPATKEERDIELLLDIPLELSVELGRVSLLVQEVVELGTGSIIELEKTAGEPVDVLVNGRLVARGEVVVIEDNFGVRVTEVISPQDRVSRLGEVA